jgi:hypothetical protein
MDPLRRFFLAILSKEAGSFLKKVVSVVTRSMA